MTPSKSTSLLWFVLPLALFAAGCQKDAAQEADTATENTADAAPAESERAPSPETAVDTSAGLATEPPIPVPGTDAAIIEDHSSPTMAAPGFDAMAFEGRYVSGETSLLISADGVYALNIDGATIDGTWSPQPGGKRVTLDPDSKDGTDRQLDIVSKDSVNIVGGATLTRDNSAQ
jgi:hypothetical protein